MSPASPNLTYNFVYWRMKKIIINSVLACVVLMVVSVSSFAQTRKPVLNHIALSVKNLARSTAFYSKIIQLDTIPEPFHDGKHTWFSIAERSHLHLIEYSDPIIVPAKGTHLCFSIPSIEGFIERLEKNNIPYSNWQGDNKSVTTRVDGVKQLYLQDPDGYWIEINNDK